MVIYSLWLGQLALETTLLVHLLVRQLYAHYPYFFLYLSIIWAMSVVQWIVYHWVPSHYTWVFWSGELFTVLAGFFLVWEIFRQTFNPFPAIRQRTSWAILALVLLIFLVNALLGFTSTGRLDDLVYRLERWLRLLQAALLALTLLATHRYRLPLGRNVAGLLVGFGLFASLNVASVASLALARIDLTRWGHLYAVTYLVTLLIWCFTLWRYVPNPLSARPEYLEQDYARLTAAMGAALEQVQSGLRRIQGRG